jgi:Phage conserved hypothetical protein BR0599/Uncharacterized conserved protein (DUF2163)
MKRLMPSSLVNISGTGFLQTNPNCLKADLFAITLPTGTVMYVTEGQWDITVPSGTPGWTGATTTFLATTYGRWSRGSITSEAGFGLAANSMSLTCVPQQGTSYPGLSLGILSAAFNGLFDVSKISVYTAYMPMGGYGNVSNGIETKFFGFIEKITKINRTVVEFECQDPLYLLNEKIPKRLIQSSCPWSFGDSNCNVAGGLAAFTQTFTATSGSTQTLLIPATAFTQAVGYFSQGFVTCTGGQNNGLSQTVKLHDASGHLQLNVSWILPVAIGDTFSAVAGCEKSVTACATRKTAAGGSVNNQIHFGGAIDVPVPITGL